jgi:hypothetical protein
MFARRRGAAWLAACLAGSLLVGACGAEAAPSPAASPTVAPATSPAATPTSSPAPDVAGLFLKKIVSPDASGTATLGGRLSIAALEAPITGSFRFRGSDSSSLMTITFAGNNETNERTSIGGVGYTRRIPGPWLEDEANQGSSSSLPQVLKSFASMEDAGVEQQGGRELHRLRPPEGSELPPEALGFSDPAIRDPKLTLEFLVTADGTPAAMEISGTWTQAIEGVTYPVSMTMTFTSETWGGSVAIVKPVDVWTVHASALGYSMAYPPGWAVEPYATGDDYLVDGEVWVSVDVQTIPSDMTTQRFRDYLVSSFQRESGLLPESDEPVSLGGQAAHRLTYYRPVEGGENAIFDYVTARGGRGWDLYMVTAAGPGELEDLALLEMFAATFTFGP